MRSIKRTIAKAKACHEQEQAEARHTLAVHHYWTSMTPNDRIKMMARSSNLTVTDLLAQIASRKGL